MSLNGADAPPPTARDAASKSAATTLHRAAATRRIEKGFAVPIVGVGCELQQQALVVFDHPLLGKPSFDDAARMLADGPPFVGIRETREVLDERVGVVGAEQEPVV